MLLNARRLQSLMVKTDVSLVVATSPANVRYFTDHACSLETTFTNYMMTPGGVRAPFFPAAATYDGEGCALVLHALLAVSAMGSWAGELRAYGAEPSPSRTSPSGAVDAVLCATAHARPHDFVSELAANISAQTTAGDRVAVDPDGLTDKQWNRLVDALDDRTLLRAPVLLRLCRMVKTDAEITRAETAATASETAFTAMLDAAHAGTCADELALVYRSHLAGHGADLEHCAFGNLGLGILTPPSQYPFGAQEVMLADVGCTLNGIISDTGATLAIGEPNNDAVYNYEAVRDSVEAGSSMIRGGSSVAQIHQAMLQALDDFGVQGTGASGHGLGIEPKEYPLIGGHVGVLSDDCITVDADIVLESDMVLNLECPLNVPPEYSVHVEKTFVVTENGSRALIPQDRVQMSTVT